MPRLALPLLALLLAACGAPTRYHIVDTPALDKNPSFHAPATRQYALRETALPDYLSAQYLIYRNANGETIIDKTQLWGQKFPENLRRVLGEALAQRTGSDRIYVYPIASNLRPERLIDVQIGEMIADYRSGNVIFRSKWQISAPGEASPPSHSLNRDYPLPSLDAQGIVATYRQILTDLSTAITTSLNP
ncbi:MAG: ABC-type transport auxiliary lipoprotein family protein [Cardiobacteriaceae bacterium]|nr:ABC-type transport auxiliary lipoprotein family protein [Cardiobacteriaceae bacterium]